MIIFDSLNIKELDNCYKIFLEKLHPYVFEKNYVISFPDVQQQPNYNDCGIFAIANAISLFKGYDPSEITYDLTTMRNHLKEIFNNNIIEMFPCHNLDINSHSGLNIFMKSIYNTQNIHRLVPNNERLNNNSLEKNNDENLNDNADQISSKQSNSNNFDNISNISIDSDEPNNEMSQYNINSEGNNSIINKIDTITTKERRRRKQSTKQKNLKDKKRIREKRIDENYSNEAKKRKKENREKNDIINNQKTEENAENINYESDQNNINKKNEKKEANSNRKRKIMIEI